MHHLTAEWALLEDGFAASCVSRSDGAIVSIDRSAPDAAMVGVMLPGMPDLHSHGFQRAFAGLTNWAGGGGDFWTWREAMYRAVATMSRRSNPGVRLVVQDAAEGRIYLHAGIPLSAAWP